MFIKNTDQILFGLFCNLYEVFMLKWKIIYGLILFEYFHLMNELPSAPAPIKYQITLPKINFKKIKTSRTPQQENLLQFSYQQCTEELAKLDQWSNSLPTVRRKKNQTSESIMFLYKSNNKYSGHLNRLASSKEALVASVGLYLAQLDAQLGKIKKINYDAIYQNVEYCAGVYEIAFNQILKKLQNTKKMLQDNLKEKVKNIEQFRQKKLNEMRAKKQMINDKRSEYQRSYFSLQSSKTKQSQDNHKQGIQNSLSSTRYKQNQKEEGQVSKRVEKNRILIDFKQSIEDKYKQLKSIKTLLQKLQKARVRVLYFSLELGFDVRQQGLIWILKQINKESSIGDEQNNKQNTFYHNYPQTPITIDRQNKDRLRDKDRKLQKQKQIPKITQFPNFLTQQEINFIISKFNNDFKLKVIQTEKLSKEEQQKAILQNAFENVRRDRNRKLSMIKQKQLLEKLLNQKKCQVAAGHKYITCETVRLMQNSQKIKYTKNQLIYKQTLKKLNRFCIQQMHNKKSKQQINLSSSKCSINTSSNSSKLINKNSSITQNNEEIHKLMNEVKKMLTQANKLKDKQQKIKNQEQKQLSDILIKLRNERYEGRICSDRRNPISVIACLVGWKKAKKIIQNQMNISMFTTHQK